MDLRRRSRDPLAGQGDGRRKFLGVQLATVEQLGGNRQTGYNWRKAAIEKMLSRS